MLPDLLAIAQNRYEKVIVKTVTVPLHQASMQGQGALNGHELTNAFIGCGQLLAIVPCTFPVFTYNYSQHGQQEKSLHTAPGLQLVFGVTRDEVLQEAQEGFKRLQDETLTLRVAIDDKLSMIRNQDQQINRLESAQLTHLEELNALRSQVKQRQESLQQMERDLAAVRQHIGSKVFDEALKNEIAK